jgi:hypothetical protein
MINDNNFQTRNNNNIDIIDQFHEQQQSRFDVIEKEYNV